MPLGSQFGIAPATQARKHLETLCGEIFREQLDGWYRVPSSWPKRRDFDAFDRWFAWSFHSVIVDLCADPLIQEEDLNIGAHLRDSRPPRVLEYLDATGSTCGASIAPAAGGS